MHHRLNGYSLKEKTSVANYVYLQYHILCHCYARLIGLRVYDLIQLVSILFLLTCSASSYKGSRYRIV